MSVMNQSESVKTQYLDDKNLSIRINLHAKYSTNPKGFVPWLFEQYAFSENLCILELGCGNGNQWEGRIDTLPKGCKLILSDFSSGMVETVKEKHAGYAHVCFEQIDIQNIDYPKETFDIVIANHMLYHVPDLSKALCEVDRVLKHGGIFYSTTNGNGGMHLFLRNAFKQIDPNTKAFSQEWTFNLQNAEEILSPYFTDVKRHDYIDSLSITQTQDLIAWMKSTLSIESGCKDQLDSLYHYFEDIQLRDGAIHIPKESGLFISRK